jgi:hypothetical protein
MSVYAKPAELGYLLFRVDDLGGNGVWAGYNLTTGVVATAATAAGAGWTAASASTVAEGNGYYRCILTFASAAGNVNIRPLVLADTAGTNNPFTPVTFNGDGTSGIYAWGAQLELGPVATPYIPTTTVAASRMDNGVSDAEGCMSARIYPVSRTGAATRIMSFNQTGSPGLFLNSDTKAGIYDGTNTPVSDPGISLLNKSNTIRGVWGPSLLDITLNGLLSHTTSYDGTMIGSPIYIGSNIAGLSDPMFLSDIKFGTSRYGCQ